MADMAGDISEKEGIPEEYLPRRKQSEEEDAMTNLFHHSDDSSCESEEVEEISIHGHHYHLVRPPDAVGLLFCDRVWSGSKLLARHITSLFSDGTPRSTVELGAGTGLPSLAALRNGSLLSVLTDYPDPLLLASLRRTVGRNFSLARVPERVAVVGHEWGKDMEEVLEVGCSRFGKGFRFDVVILSECLWNHALHNDLARSVDALLSLSGVALVTYAHHVPGKERDDDAFFDVCKEYGFVSQRIQTESMEYMWDRDKSIDVYLVVLSRSSSDNK